jgi:hypothetical protein
MKVKDYVTSVERALIGADIEELDEMDVARLAHYDALWQHIRVSMLGTWTNNELVAKNVQKLIHYIEYGPSTEDPIPALEAKGRTFDRFAPTCRAHRVINYMNAIRMGYHAIDGMVGSYCDTAIIGMRTFANKKYFQGIYDGNRFEIVGRTALLLEWAQLPESSKRAIVVDLKKRVMKTEDMVNRPELAWFIKTVDGR